MKILLSAGKRTRGFRGLWRAIGHSCSGFRHGILHEAPIRQQLIALAVMVPLSVLLPVSDLEHLILVLSMMTVVFAEFLNSAIEATVNRISLDRHPLSKQAKDLASAAVFIAVLMSCLSWVVIAGPVVLRFFRK